MAIKLPVWLQVTPIAWLQLRYQRSQTIAALLGITFTTVLIFMQIGFRTSFLDSLVNLPERYQGDAFIVNIASETLIRPIPFKQDDLNGLGDTDGVESITPIYLAATLLRDPNNPDLFLRSTQVIGLPIREPQALDIDGVNPTNFVMLEEPDSFLIDQSSRPEFQPLVTDVSDRGDVTTEIRLFSGLQTITISGLFTLGTSTDFGGNLITTDETFKKFFGGPSGNVSLAIVKFETSTDPTVALEDLRQKLPPDLKILPKSEAIANERNFYETRTPIGVIFRFGLAGSVLVGAVIIYQILYTKVSKYIPEYATLKAIGFRHRSLMAIVFQEALFLAILGYIPGVILTTLMYQVLASSTGMSFIMRIHVAWLVLAVVAAICIVAAAIAVDKLRDANPADVF